MKTQAIKSKKFAADFKNYLRSIENLVRYVERITDSVDGVDGFVEEMFPATNTHTINESQLTDSSRALFSIENVSTRMAKEAKLMAKMLKSVQKKMKKVNLSDIQAAELVAEQAQQGKLDKERMKAEKKAAKKSKERMKAEKKAEKKAAKKSKAEKKAATPATVPSVEADLPRVETITVPEPPVQDWRRDALLNVLLKG